MTRAEAIELVAGKLLADGMHAENVAYGLLPDEDYARLMAKIALDALLAAGMTFGEPPSLGAIWTDADGRRWREVEGEGTNR